MPNRRIIAASSPHRSRILCAPVIDGMCAPVIDGTWPAAAAGERVRLTSVGAGPPIVDAAELVRPHGGR